MNQNYVSKVLNNSRTPEENREVVIAYVLNHPDKFTPLAQNTDDLIQDEWASKRNGATDFGFMKSFRRRHLYLNRSNRGRSSRVCLFFGPIHIILRRRYP